MKQKVLWIETGKCKRFNVLRITDAVGYSMLPGTKLALSGVMYARGPFFFFFFLELCLKRATCKW